MTGPWSMANWAVAFTMSAIAIATILFNTLAQTNMSEAMVIVTVAVASVRSSALPLPDAELSCWVPQPNKQLVIQGASFIVWACALALYHCPRRLCRWDLIVGYADPTNNMLSYKDGTSAMRKLAHSADSGGVGTAMALQLVP